MSSTPAEPDDGAETWEVVIESDSYSKTEILEHLTATNLSADGIAVELRKPRWSFRAVDTAILVAIIGAAGSNLTALVAGLLQLRTHHKDRHISIELASGDKIDVPADISAEELNKLVISLGRKPKRLFLP